MTQPKERYSVVAGIFFNEGRVLMGRRHDREGRFAGYWEFPGGKVEEAEDDHQALKREFNEELSAEIEVLSHFKSISWDYPDRVVDLRFYLIRLLHEISEDTELVAHSELRWFSIADALKELVLPANRQILEALNSPT